MSNFLDDYNFELPEELIASTPVFPRDSSKLLQYRDAEISEYFFKDLVDLVPANSVFVLNDSKVAKARLKFYIAEKQVEVFVVSSLFDSKIDYKILCSPGKLFKIGCKFEMPGGIIAEVVSIEADGTRIIRLSSELDIYDYLNEHGETPLPPYIKTDNPDLYNERYQTVYAKNYGSVAAPTAGLHFTDELIAKLKNKGCVFLEVTLNVGLGTFMPVKTKNILEHKMHSESFSVSIEVAEKLNKHKKNGDPLIAVGTTSLRVLQSCFEKHNDSFAAGQGETDIFIYPGFKDFVVDAMITNFHLPKSTLFMLISAIIGIDEAKKVYNFAIRNSYRFYSFGDANLIWL